jgi:hypothetical protein
MMTPVRRPTCSTNDNKKKRKAASSANDAASSHKSAKVETTAVCAVAPPPVAAMPVATFFDAAEVIPTLPPKPHPFAAAPPLPDTNDASSSRHHHAVSSSKRPRNDGDDDYAVVIDVDEHRDDEEGLPTINSKTKKYKKDVTEAAAVVPAAAMPLSDPQRVSPSLPPQQQKQPEHEMPAATTRLPSTYRPYQFARIDDSRNNKDNNKNNNNDSAVMVVPHLQQTPAISPDNILLVPPSPPRAVPSPREPTNAAVAAAPASPEAKTGLEAGQPPLPPVPNQNVDPFHNRMMDGCGDHHDHHHGALAVRAEIPINPQRSTVAGYLLFGLSMAVTIVLWSIIAVRVCQGLPLDVGMLSLVAETWEVYRRPSQPPSVMPRRSTVERFCIATAWVPAAWLWLLVVIAAVGGKSNDPSEFVTATLKAGTWTYVRYSISIQHWQVLKSVLFSVMKWLFLGAVIVLCLSKQLSACLFANALGCGIVIWIGSSMDDYFVERKTLWETKVVACQDTVWTALLTRRGEEIATADLYDAVYRDTIDPRLRQNLYRVWFELEQRVARDKHIIAVTHDPTTGSTQWCRYA